MMTYLDRYLNDIPYDDTKNSIKLVAEKILKKDLLQFYKKKAIQ